MEALVRENNLDSIFDFMGFREDIDEIFKMSDLDISSSEQEGLGLNLIEEMMVGLPILATQDRGHKEIVIQGVNGFLYKQENKHAFIKHLKQFYNNTEGCEKFGKNAYETSHKSEAANLLEEMSKIYRKFLY
jgi:glycosyltransferase EpsD